jgi:hypothetical protein
MSRTHHHKKHKLNAVAARSLGWASLAIGTLELLAPKKLEQTMGVGSPQTTGILRILGVREIMHGFDILTNKNPNAGVKARVAGDMLDGALLTAAATRTNRPGGLLTIAALVLPIVIADLLLAKRR